MTLLLQVFLTPIIRCIASILLEQQISTNEDERENFYENPRMDTSVLFTVNPEFFGIRRLITVV